MSSSKVIPDSASTIHTLPAANTTSSLYPNIESALASIRSLFDNTRAPISMGENPNRLTANDSNQLLIARPISDLLESTTRSPEKLYFCYIIVNNTLESLLNRKYSHFDAHTTSNCCHGASLWARHLIQHAEDGVVLEFQAKCKAILATKPNPNSEVLEFPAYIIELARVYTLSCIKEIDPNRGIFSSNRKLLDLHPIGRAFCDNLIKALQHRTSNLVAKSYYEYFTTLEQTTRISQIAITIWGRYVHPSQLRSDNRGIQYAPCLYSMQVSLAYLISKNAVIACANDVFDSEDVWKGRILRLLRGNRDKGQFELVSPIEYESIPKNLPSIMFSGASEIPSETPQEIGAVAKEFDSWMDRFSYLVLACDSFYPHFPRVVNDPEFNSAPIQPIESDLQELLQTYSKTLGVSAKKPSLWCLNHIYPVSIPQILSAIQTQEKDALPIYKIPNLLKK